MLHILLHKYATVEEIYTFWFQCGVDTWAHNYSLKFINMSNMRSNHSKFMLFLTKGRINNTQCLPIFKCDFEVICDSWKFLLPRLVACFLSKPGNKPEMCVMTNVCLLSIKLKEG